MFVPSESIYADLHDGFDDVVQKAYRARVVIVSPSLLMLAIQVMQQIFKDARMREAADQIRTEVGRLMEDLGRLRERVLKLQQHFGQTTEDLRQIVISSDKIEKRASRIEELDFDDDDTAASADVIAAPLPSGGAQPANDRGTRSRAAGVRRNACGLFAAARTDRAFSRLLVRACRSPCRARRFWCGWRGCGRRSPAPSAYSPLVGSRLTALKFLWARLVDALDAADVLAAVRRPARLAPALLAAAGSWSRSCCSACAIRPKSYSACRARGAASSRPRRRPRTS